MDTLFTAMPSILSIAITLTSLAVAIGVLLVIIAIVVDAIKWLRSLFVDQSSNL